MSMSGNDLKGSGDKSVSKSQGVMAATAAWLIKKYFLIERFGRVTISYESSWLALYIVPNA